MSEQKQPGFHRKDIWLIMLLAPQHGWLAAHVILVFWTSLAIAVGVEHNNEQPILSDSTKKGYTKGAPVPVSCLNRTIETGEHVQDASGGLQYIPFPFCNETASSLAFAYGEPASLTCTIDNLEDELYHLLEFYVHNDVPLSCRVPSFPLSAPPSESKDVSFESDIVKANQWTPLTIALQGTLQLSHLHIHTSINVLLHSSPESHLIAATAYSLPNITKQTPYPEGSKIIRGEPVIFTFNVGWIDGTILPGMVGKPLQRVTDHGIGFFLLCVFGCLASAGVGGMAMMQYERRKWRGTKGIDGILGANGGRSNGYGGYGGYG